MTFQVSEALNRTVVHSDWRFDNSCGSHLQSQSELWHLHQLMVLHDTTHFDSEDVAAKTVKMSVTLNNSPIQDLLSQMIIFHPLMK